MESTNVTIVDLLLTKNMFHRAESWFDITSEFTVKEMKVVVKWLLY
jgi:hypothetical protein